MPTAVTEPSSTIMSAAGLALTASLSTALGLGNYDPAVVAVWIVTACLGGAAASLLIQPFKNMSPGQVVLSLIMSTSFACICAPLVARMVSKWFFQGQPTDLQLLGALMWIMAAGAHILVPLVIRQAAKRIEKLGGSSTEEKP